MNKNYVFYYNSIYYLNKKLEIVYYSMNNHLIQFHNPLINKIQQNNQNDNEYEYYKKQINIRIRI